MLMVKDFEKSVVSTTDFQRKSGSYLKEMKNSEDTLFITKKNIVEAILINPKKYDLLVESAQRLEEISIAYEVLKGRQSDQAIDLHDESVQNLFK